MLWQAAGSPAHTHDNTLIVVDGSSRHTQSAPKMAVRVWMFGIGALALVVMTIFSTALSLTASPWEVHELIRAVGGKQRELHQLQAWELGSGEAGMSIHWQTSRCVVLTDMGS